MRPYIFREQANIKIGNDTPVAGRADQAPHTWLQLDNGWGTVVEERTLSHAGKVFHAGGYEGIIGHFEGKFVTEQGSSKPHRDIDSLPERKLVAKRMEWIFP